MGLCRDAGVEKLRIRSCIEVKKWGLNDRYR